MDSEPVPSLRFMQSPGHEPYVDAYMADLREVAEHVRSGQLTPTAVGQRTPERRGDTGGPHRRADGWVVVIRGARLIDGLGDAARTDLDVIVTGELILAIEPADTARRSRGTPW